MPQSQEITTSKTNNKVGIVGVPLCKGQPRMGTELGPLAIREGGLIKKLTNLGLEITDYGDLDFEDHEQHEHDNTKNPMSVAAASEKIADMVTDVVKSGKTCLNLGGDHSMAIGSIFGHARAEPNVCVIWVDAHADINTPLTSESGNIHGMPLSFLVKELESCLPTMPGFDNIKPCISAKDIAYIGLRDVDPGERYIIEQHDICCFSMQEVDKYGIKEVMERALQAVDPRGERMIHLSFDVDALDPTLTPCTGTPVHGGLSLREGSYIAEELANTGRLSVVDIAEVNPNLGNKLELDKTVSMTMEIIQRCFGHRRQGNYPKGYDIPRPGEKISTPTVKVN